MRGEDFNGCDNPARIRGSPPHARGRLMVFDKKNHYLRITPACAGKTKALAGVDRHVEDHPRMRGEDTTLKKFEYPSIGSPPHARGRQLREPRFRHFTGITPACAGKTLIRDVAT